MESMRSPLAGQGKEQTEDMFSKLLKNVRANVVDISSMSKSWNETTWLWGYAKNHFSCQFGPNSAGAFKLVVFGEMDVYMVDTFELINALNTVKEPAENATDLFEYVQGMKADDINKLKAANKMHFYHRRLKNEQLIWIPTGWMGSLSLWVTTAHCSTASGRVSSFRRTTWRLAMQLPRSFWRMQGLQSRRWER